MSYEEQAERLYAALVAGDDDAAWRFKWEHPRFRGETVDKVRPADLTLDDARLVVAQQQMFDTWDELMEFVAHPDSRFESAADMVVSGELDALRAALDASPKLVHARSQRRHHATLLHYIAANGVEGERQKTPPNAVESAKLLLDRGAEVDAFADMYEDPRTTTMNMLVSSAHPAGAGLQSALAETLIDYGAALDQPPKPLLTALAFGYRDTAETLARRGAPIDTLAAAAGLGRMEDAKRLLPNADANDRHAALALAAQHGHAEIVRLLLDAGEDPSRYNPKGFHAHSTPLHQAVWGNYADVVRALVEGGASLELRDRIYSGTPLDWANYGKRTEMAEYLRNYSR